MSQSTYDVNPNLGERVASLEAVYSYLAKESDVEQVRTEVEKVRTDVVKASLTQIRWLIGVVAVPTVLGLINLFIQYAK